MQILNFFPIKKFQEATSFRRQRLHQKLTTLVIELIQTKY